MVAPVSAASAPFSRLQLAAALLEYDNDPSDPDCPFRSAADSAIFAQFRKKKKERAHSVISRRSTDHLAVKLPGDRGSTVGRESVHDNYDSRRSRASIDMLRNPFSTTEGDVEEEEEGEEENMDDLDLESWGLNDLLGDKGKEKGSKRKLNNRLPNPHELQQSKGPLSPGLGPRAVSMGNFDNIGFGGAIVDDLSIKPEPRGGTEFLDERKRRASFGSPLDLVGMHVPEISLEKARRKSAYGLLESQPEPGPSSLHSIPFPSSIPQVDDESGVIIPHHDRTYSSTSRTSHLQAVSEELGRRSRFDSQGNRIKTTAPPQGAPNNDENNPFAIRPPSPSQSSRFDPKAIAHVRTLSDASMGSRILLEDPPSAHPPAPRKYPRMDLLRPKVLIMPSPLQNSEQSARPPSPTVRDGFHLSRDGPPLPAAARSVRKSMAFEGPSLPNLFTPNSRATLSLAQLTFRSGLHSQDVGYSENVGVARATTDGEQVKPPSPEPGEIPTVATPPEEKNRRGPGKLYGKSLIDDLEARKAEMRGKRRVFAGDERPSMMTRSSTHSTLIDPNSLNRPVSGRMDTSNSSQTLARRKTLLNFDDKLAPPEPMRKSTAFGPRTSNVKSVFGKDHIWEREMAKLQEMQAKEMETTGLSAEPPATGEANYDMDPSEPSPRPQEQESTILLPEIAKVSARKGPPPSQDDDGEDESDSDNSNVLRERSQPKQAEADQDWFSDEEKLAGPVRTTGSGPRYHQGTTDPPAKQKPKYIPAPLPDDSDEDVPLAATVSKVVLRTAKAAAEEESDEDQPLNTLIDKTKSKLFLGVPENKQQRNEGGDDNDDEDDQPLGLRASQFNPGASQNWLGRSGDDDEDDIPLGLHPEQQRRTQYQMFTQQQQLAQQQMMMQAQLQNSMMFSQPSFMGPSFYGPPMGMGVGIGPVMGDVSMMVPPLAPGTPPPVQDPAKFGRVDAWRRDVAVEGEPV